MNGETGDKPESQKEKGKMKKRFFVRVLALTFGALLLLTSCSAEGGKGKIDKNNNQPIVLELPINEENSAARESNGWIGFTEAMKKLAEKYQEQGKGKVEIRLVKNNAETRAKETPDVVLFDHIWTEIRPDLYHDMANGEYADLADFMSRDQDYDENAYVENVMAAGRLGSKQYILPLAYVLPTVFGDESTSAAQNTPGKADLADYESFWSKAEGCKIDLFANKWGYQDIPHDVSIVYGAGNFPNPERVADGTNAEVFLRVLEVYRKQAKNPDYYQWISLDQPVTMWDVLAEKAALHYENLGGGYSYPLAIMENRMTDKKNAAFYYVGTEPNENMFYGAIPYTPGQTKEIRTAYVSAGFMIPAASEKQESAWNFIVWCMGQKELYAQNDAAYYSFPTRLEVVRESLDIGLEQISNLYAADRPDAKALYDEVTDVGYAYLSDQAAGKALAEVMIQGSSESAEQLYENLLAVYEKSGALFD